jgi:hypothetical protein
MTSCHDMGTPSASSTTTAITALSPTIACTDPPLASDPGRDNDSFTGRESVGAQAVVASPFGPTPRQISGPEGPSPSTMKTGSLSSTRSPK